MTTLLHWLIWEDISNQWLSHYTISMYSQLKNKAQLNKVKYLKKEY